MINTVWFNHLTKEHVAMTVNAAITVNAPLPPNMDQLHKQHQAK